MIQYLVWHAYKYLVKTVHRVFFPLFCLLENTDLVAGGKVFAQRKLLYLEKLFAALLLAAPRVKDQLRARLAQLREVDMTAQEMDDKRAILLKVLAALDALLHFYLPAVFRVGHKVRCCTWEGRVAGTGKWAKEAMEQCLVLLIHLLQDVLCKNEYVRTLAVALATWQPWMEKIPAVCFMEESCEAMLSRMGHRCDVYRTLHGYDKTYDLFLTLPAPRRGLKKTRGMLKLGLVQVFASRLRKVLYSDGCLNFAVFGGARDMHSAVVEEFPADYLFAEEPPTVMPAVVFERVIHRALVCLAGKGKVNDKVEKFLDENVPEKTAADLDEYTKAVEQLQNKFKKSRAAPKPKPKAPKPPVKKKFQPKPRGMSMLVSMPVEC